MEDEEGEKKKEEPLTLNSKVLTVRIYRDPFSSWQRGSPYFLRKVASFERKERTSVWLSRSKAKRRRQDLRERGPLKDSQCWKAFSWSKVRWSWWSEVRKWTWMGIRHRAKDHRDQAQVRLLWKWEVPRWPNRSWPCQIEPVPGSKDRNWTLNAISESGQEPRASVLSRRSTWEEEVFQVHFWLSTNKRCCKCSQEPDFNS